MLVEFENSEFDIADVVSDDLRVKIYREVRTIPFYGMSQPTPRGCFSGLDTLLEISYMGRPARKYAWQLFSGDECIQIGVTDKYGFSRELNVDMPYAGPRGYRLLIDCPDKIVEQL